MSLNNVDEATAALILGLQIQDAEVLIVEHQRGCKGKGKEGDVADLEIALKIYKQELQRYAFILRDRHVARKIQIGYRTHTNVLAGKAPLAQLLLEALPPKNIAEEIVPGVEDKNGESSSWAATRKHPKTHCVACQEPVERSNMANAACGHEYCAECIQELFRSSMKDESLFPPRCCRQLILLADVRRFLDADLLQQFKEKKVEFETPNRTYCSNVPCSAFIPTESIVHETATCPHCTTLTCTMCKSAAHKGDCPADSALQAVLELSSENGWQRCSTCRRMVELDTGCNHITCICKAQFCYVCGLTWRTCRCPQWDVNRLYSRAAQVVRRLPRLGRNSVETVARQLQERHNCNHNIWRTVDGSHLCEQCQNVMPEFILECRQCSLQACKRCRMNRL